LTAALDVDTAVDLGPPTTIPAHFRPGPTYKVDGGGSMSRWPSSSTPCVDVEVNRFDRAPPERKASLT